MGAKQLAIFSVGEEEFGIDIGKISSIEQMTEIFKIPNTPGYVEGMVNLRGNVCTVLNLRKRFNMPCSEFNEMNKIIIVNVPPSVIGIIVDNVKEIAKVEDFESVRKAKQESNHASGTLSDLIDNFTGGNVNISNRTVRLLDIEKVMTTEEAGQVL